MLRAGLRVSIISLLWTLLAGTCAIALGAGSQSLTLVAFGMAGVGLGTIALSAIRLAARSPAHVSHSGVALTAVSVGVLSVLARRKRAVARRVPSQALRADGLLSGIGAVLAGVALAPALP
ncbi:MAG TPA: hypothetical protein VKR22_12890 [Acidimicrobiales bacterium]|nr:hypothetical protein [Acidimicrobiales bacterium]